MQIHDHIHLVGSGDHGFGISDRADCHVWLIDGGSGSALIDTGAGQDPQRIIDLIVSSNIDPESIQAALITHAHGDHAGGAWGLRDSLGLEVMASPEVTAILRKGDADAASIPVGQSSGAYPPDYDYRACEVDRELSDGERLKVGDVEIEVVATPGHATGHLCYLVHTEGRRDLFSGDMMLFGGKLIIQNTWDCDSVAYLESVRRLGDLDITGFFPGHFSYSLERGQRHIEIANEALDRGQFPPTL